MHSGDGTGVVRLNDKLRYYLNHLMDLTIFFIALSSSFGGATFKQNFQEAVVSLGSVRKLKTVNTLGLPVPQTCVLQTTHTSLSS